MSETQNKKITVAVVGLASRGLSFSSTFHNDPRSELIAVCDIKEKNLDIIKKDPVLGKKVSLYNNIDELLQKESPDLVCISASDFAHHELAVKTLEAGCNIFLEKPMAQTIEDCDDIIRAWKKAGTIFFIGFELRFCTLFQQMKSIINRGKIGEVVMCHAMDSVSVGGQFFFHRYFRKKEKGRSLLLQKGTHSIDLVNWMIGSDPKRVYAVGGLKVFGQKEPASLMCHECSKKDTCKYFISRDKFTYDFGKSVSVDDFCVYGKDVDMDDHSLVTIEYENGAKAVYTECHFTPDYIREFTFIGTEGKMYGLYSRYGFKITLQRRFSEKVEVYRPKVTEGSHGGGDKRMFENIFNVISSKEKSSTDIKAGRDSAAIAICAEKSIKEGVPAEVPKCPYL